jgi:hypothetical protein
LLSVASCVILFPVSERNTKMNTTNIIDRVDSENANLRSQIDRLTGKAEDIVHMEKHTLENWGKLPEGWTPAKELENNLKDIRRNLKNSA